MWYDESQGPERKSAKSPDEGMTFGFQTKKGSTTTISDYGDDPKKNELQSNSWQLYGLI